MTEGRRVFAAFGDLDRPRRAQPARPGVAIAWSVRLAIDEGEFDLGAAGGARSVLAGDPEAVIDWLRATEHLAYGLTMRGELDAADELTAAGLGAGDPRGPGQLALHLLQRRALSAQRHSQASWPSGTPETVLAARAIGYDRIVARPSRSSRTSERPSSVRKAPG